MSLLQEVRRDYYNQALRLATEHLQETGELIRPNEIAEQALYYAEQKYTGGTPDEQRKLLAIGSIDYEKQKQGIFSDVLKYGQNQVVGTRAAPVINPYDFEHPNYDAEKFDEYLQQQAERVAVMTAPGSPWGAGFKGKPHTGSHITVVDELEREIDRVMASEQPADEPQGSTKAVQMDAISRIDEMLREAEEVERQVTGMSRSSVQGQTNPLEQPQGFSLDKFLRPERYSQNKHSSTMPDAEQVVDEYLKHYGYIQEDAQGNAYYTVAQKRIETLSNNIRHNPEKYWAEIQQDIGRESAPESISGQVLAFLSRISQAGADIITGVNSRRNPGTTGNEAADALADTIGFLSGFMMPSSVGTPSVPGTAFNIGDYVAWSVTPKVAKRLGNRLPYGLIESAIARGTGFGILQGAETENPVDAAKGFAAGAISSVATYYAGPMVRALASKLGAPVDPVTNLPVTAVERIATVMHERGTMFATMTLTHGILNKVPAKELARDTLSSYGLGLLVGGVFGAYPEAKLKIQNNRAAKQAYQNMPTVEKTVAQMLEDGWVPGSKPGMWTRGRWINGKWVSGYETTTISVQLKYKGQTMNLTELLKRFGEIPKTARVVTAPSVAGTTAPWKVAPESHMLGTGQQPAAPATAAPVATQAPTTPTVAGIPQPPPAGSQPQAAITPTPAPVQSVQLRGITNIHQAGQVIGKLSATNPAKAWELKRQIVEAQKVIKESSGAVIPEGIDPVLAQHLSELPNISLTGWLARVKEPGASPVAVTPVTEPQANAGEVWQNLDLKQREALVREGRWVTKQGNITKAGQRFMESNWDDLPLAAQRTLSKIIGENPITPVSVERPSEATRLDERGVVGDEKRGVDLQTATPRQEVQPEKAETVKVESSSVAEYIQSDSRPKATTVKAATILNTTLPKKSSVPILQYAVVQDGLAYTTNSDVATIVRTELPDGAYKIVGGKMQEASLPGDLEIAKDYPFPGKIDTTNGSAVVKYGALSDAFKRAMLYVSNQKTQPAFNYVLLDVDGGKGVIVSSDNYRLDATPIDVNGIKDGRYLISKDAIKAILKDGKAQSVALHAGVNKGKRGFLTFDTGNAVVMSRLGEENYPDISRITPKKVDRASALNTKEVLNVMKQIKELKPEGSNAAMFVKVTPNGFDITIQSSVTEKEHKFSIPAKHMGGGSVPANMSLLLPVKRTDGVKEREADFILNSKFFADVLTGYNRDTVYMGWTNDNNPLVFTPEKGMTSAKPTEGKSETVGYSPPASTAQPAPLTGEQRASINAMLKIIDDVVPTRIGKFQTRGRAGIYKWATAKGDPESVARLAKQFGRSISVASHEMGHHLDKIVGFDDNRFDNELLAIPYVQELMAEKSSWTTKRLRREGVAEVVRMYIMDNAGAQRLAPNFYRQLETKLYAEQPIIYDKIQDLRAMWEHLSAHSSVESVLDDFMGIAPDRNKYSKHALRERFEGWRNPVSGLVSQMLTRFIDSTYPVTKVVEEITGMPANKTNAWVWIRTGASDGRVESLIIDGQYRDDNDYAPKIVRHDGKTSFDRREAERLAKELYRKSRIVKVLPDPKDPNKWQIHASDTFKLEKFVEIGPSMMEIIKKVEGLGKGKEGREHVAEWTRYMVTKHAIELEESGITSGALKPELGVTLKSLRDFAKKVEQSQHADVYIAQAKELFKLRNHAFQWLVDSGLYSIEERDTILGKWEWNVPFKRVDMTPGVQRRDPNFRPVKGITGRDQQIKDPLLSIMQEAYIYNKVANTHDVLTTFIDEIGDFPIKAGRFIDKVNLPQKAITVGAEEALEKLQEIVAFGDVKMLEDDQSLQDLVLTIFRPITQRGKDYLVLRRAGKPVAYEVSDKFLLDALIGTNKEWATWLGSKARQLSNVFRLGHITNTVFPWRNPHRDMMIATGYSESGFIPYATFIDGAMAYLFDTPKARIALEGFTKQFDLTEQNAPGSLLKSFIENDQTWAKLWRYHGGTMRSPDLFNHDALEKLMRKMGMATAEGRAWRVWNSNINPWQWIKAIATASEMITNLGETKKGMRQGFDPLKASSFGRTVTIDHQMVGSSMRLLKDLIPFINPRIQGHFRLFQQMKDPDMRYKTLLKWFYWITLPSIIHFLWVKDNPHWQEMDRGYKDAWMLIPIGNRKTTSTFMPIPRAHSIVGFIFGAFPARAAEYLYTQDKKAFKEWEQSLWRAVNPSMTIWFYQLWNDLKHNVNSYSGIDIENETDLRKPKKERYSHYTTETAKLLGVVFNVSPKKIDYAQRYSTGALGRVVFAVVDSMLRVMGFGDQTAKPKATIADMTIVGDYFRRSSSGGSNSINDIYDLRDKAEEIKGSSSGFVNRREHKLVSVELPKLEAITGELSNLRKRVIEVREDPRLTPAQKRDMIDYLETAQINIARLYWGLDLIPNQMPRF